MKTSVYLRILCPKCGKWSNIDLREIERLEIDVE